MASQEPVLKAYYASLFMLDRIAVFIGLRWRLLKRNCQILQPKQPDSLFESRQKAPECPH